MYVINTFKFLNISVFALYSWAWNLVFACFFISAFVLLCFVVPFRKRTHKFCRVQPVFVPVFLHSKRFIQLQGSWVHPEYNRFHGHCAFPKIFFVVGENWTLDPSMEVVNFVCLFVSLVIVIFLVCSNFTSPKKE